MSSGDTVEGPAPEDENGAPVAPRPCPGEWGATTAAGGRWP